MRTPERTPSQDRGDIQSGATRDKTPGFDPAAAPLETDAEAADMPTAAHPTPLRDPGFTNQATFANAMRPVGSQPQVQPRSNWPLLVIAAVVVVAVAVFVIAATLR